MINSNSNLSFVDGYNLLCEYDFRKSSEECAKKIYESGLGSFRALDEELQKPEKKHRAVSKKMAPEKSANKETS